MSKKKQMSKKSAVASMTKKEGMSKQNAQKVLAWANATKNGKTTTGHGNRWKGGRGGSRGR